MVTSTLTLTFTYTFTLTQRLALTLTHTRIGQGVARLHHILRHRLLRIALTPTLTAPPPLPHRFVSALFTSPFAPTLMVSDMLTSTHTRTGEGVTRLHHILRHQLLALTLTLTLTFSYLFIQIYDPFPRPYLTPKVMHTISSTHTLTLTGEGGSSVTSYPSTPTP